MEQQPSLISAIQKAIAPVIDAAMGRGNWSQTDNANTTVHDLPAGMLGGKCSFGGKRYEIRDNTQRNPGIDLILCNPGPGSSFGKPMKPLQRKSRTVPIPKGGRDASPIILSSLLPLPDTDDESDDVPRPRGERVAGCSGGRRQGRSRGGFTSYGNEEDECINLTWQREILENLELNCDVRDVCVTCDPRKCNGIRPKFTGNGNPITSVNGGIPIIVPNIDIAVNLSYAVYPEPSNWNPMQTGFTVLVFTTADLIEAENQDNPNWLEAVIMAPDRGLTYNRPRQVPGTLDPLLSSYEVIIPTVSGPPPAGLDNMNALSIPPRVQGRVINVFAFNVTFSSARGDDRWIVMFCGGQDGGALRNVNVGDCPL